MTVKSCNNLFKKKESSKKCNILPVRPKDYIQAIGLTGMGFYVCDKKSVNLQYNMLGRRDKRRDATRRPSV